MKTIKNITLESRVTESPDTGGFLVKEGDFFEAEDYAEYYDLNVDDIEEVSIQATQDKVGRLSPGEWMEVTHEVEFFEEEDDDDE